MSRPFVLGAVLIAVLLTSLCVASSPRHNFGDFFPRDDLPQDMRLLARDNVFNLTSYYQNAMAENIRWLKSGEMMYGNVSDINIGRPTVDVRLFVYEYTDAATARQEVDTFARASPRRMFANGIEVRWGLTPLTAGSCFYEYLPCETGEYVWTKDNYVFRVATSETEQSTAIAFVIRSVEQMVRIQHENGGKLPLV